MTSSKPFPPCVFSCLAALLMLAATDHLAPAQPSPRQCHNVIKADVVAIAQPYLLNRLGAAMPNALIFALASDVDLKLLQLKHYKRPRPIVLRANVGDCLQITLTNLITQYPGAQPTPSTSRVSLHVQGMQLMDTVGSDGSFVGVNNSSLANSPQCADPDNPGTTIPCVKTPEQPPPTPASPGEKRTYNLFAQAEGTFLLYSLGDADTAGQQLEQGLFGSVNVQPRGAEWYRSQVTADDLTRATKGASPGGQPYLDYNQRYPADYQIDARRCAPILRMADDEYQWQGAQCVKVNPDAGTLPPHTGRVLKLYHTDLTAIVTGPDQGRFPGTTGVGNPEPPCNLANDPNNRVPVDPLFCANPTVPDRKQPYREVTTIYHEVANATQAFPVLSNNNPTTASGQDAFAINYGTGGIGAEIYANRTKVGPMANCVDCKYEEFFLSSWSVGDPAMVVDVPANSAPATKGAKATKAHYPDDPSNVYHSYLNDHIKFRVLHGGIGVTHVHHQHAAQWLQSPNSDQSNYLDSQMLSPGTSYSLEMVYDGSGNLNKTAGDSIFHCHFYPHFAAGMWAHWRIHDVFEAGTVMGDDGRPRRQDWNRVLPDGEIAGGTPIPAVVPLPTLPMAPLPARVKVCPVDSTYDPNKVAADCPQVNGPPIGQVAVINQDDLKRGLTPGFPFFIPGIAGARAPHPPFDFAAEVNAAGEPVGSLDGGLPRHLITGGTVINNQFSKYDWSKDFFVDCSKAENRKYVAACRNQNKPLGFLNAVQLPEAGTQAEVTAMRFYGMRQHPSFTQEGQAGSFLTNGLPRKPAAGYPAMNEYGSQRGAPFADPGVDLKGNAAGGKTPRIYKGAALQMDVRLNNKGWHFPQQRLTALWEDVVPTADKQRPPEPLFIRANSGEVVEYWHTNLVPNYYLVDDFQVRTPTDIIGQHIHLVKFDVMSSDGAANGFNYEDGTLSPEEVQEIIQAINNGGSWKPLPGGPTRLAPKPPPSGIIDCRAKPNDPRCRTWAGAQTTVQRWYLDPVLDNKGTDRTVGTIFTHDHFGPSTHQQAGLYAGVLAEPRGSVWKSLDGRVTFGTRRDGGPTSWQANVLTADPTESFREFALEFQDFQLAYTAVTANPSPYPNPDPSKGYNVRGTRAQNNLLGNAVPDLPQLISSGATSSGAPIGTMSLNYQNAPISFRINPSQDLSYAFASFKLSANLPSNGDPGTPLLRAYKNDRVRVRTLVGAHQLAHFFTLRGMSWLAEPEWKNSGFKSSQAMGLSEYFDLKFRVPPSSVQTVKPCPDTPQQASSSCNFADYLYVASSGDMGIANGLWGLFRAYDATQAAAGLEPLPNNPVATTNKIDYATCPPGAPVRQFNVTATTAKQALQGGAIPLNSRLNLTNPLGMIYVRTEDLDQNGNLRFTRDANGKFKEYLAPVEPLVLRVAAGDCVRVTLTNSVSAAAQVLRQPYALQAPFDSPTYQLTPSPKVGLHPELLAYDVTTSDGVNVGYNAGKNQVASIPTSGKPAPVNYEWYAGAIERNQDGSLKHTPIEFGAANLLPSDPLLQHINGLYGAIIVEPAGSTWTCDGPPDENGYPTQTDCWPATTSTTPIASRASATVTGTDATQFRDFVMLMTEDVKMAGASGAPTTASAVNYKTEPIFSRFRNPGQVNVFAANGDNYCSLSNALVLAGKNPATSPVLSGDPETPIYTAKAGTPVRFRMLHPPGTGIAQVFTLNGHLWQRNPYVNDSTQIGSNALSQWMGSLDSLGSTTHYDLVIEKAGGQFEVPGDYLYTAFVPSKAQFGMWGLFRVRDKDGKVVTGSPSSGPVMACGTVTAISSTAITIRINFQGQNAPVAPGATQSQVNKLGSQSGSVLETFPIAPGTVIKGATQSLVGKHACLSYKLNAGAQINQGAIALSTNSDGVYFLCDSADPTPKIPMLARPMADPLERFRPKPGTKDR